MYVMDKECLAKFDLDDVFKIFDIICSLYLFNSETSINFYYAIYIAVQANSYGGLSAILLLVLLLYRFMYELYHSLNSTLSFVYFSVLILCIFCIYI